MTRYTISLLAAATLAAAAPAAAPTVGSFGFDVAGMDRRVAPGDDFNAFANGAWIRAARIPPDQGRAAVFLRMEQRTRDQVRAILDDAAQRPGDRVGDFYASFLDRAAADRKGIAPLRPAIRQLAGVGDRQALAALSASFQRQGVDGMFAVPWGLEQMVSADDRSPGTAIFHLRQGGLGLPNRDYYRRSDPKLAAARGAYLAYVTSLLTLAHEPNAASRAAAVLALEERIAAVHWTLSASREVEKTYNRWSPADFTANAPGFAWDRYLAGLGLSAQDGIIVAQPSAFAGEARIWAATPLAVLKDHQLVRLLDHYAPYLSGPFARAGFDFHGAALQGQQQEAPRWRRGTELVSLLMRDAVGQEYVRRHFDPATEAAAQTLVRNVVSAWRDRLAQVAWMTPSTRRAAARKLDTMRISVGHPTRWRDYGALVVRRDDLVGNVRRAYEAEFVYQLAKLARPAQRDEWAMTPMQADGYNDPVLNAVVLPAGLFQPPFFDAAADPAVNYGAIGAFIGHEISHSFDDQGRKYDASGRLTDWWTPEDVRRYAERTAKLVRQYDAYEPLPGQHIAGGLVLGETMADLGGLIVGHGAYHIALAGKQAPILDGFTGEQRFYLGWAQIWRMKYRDAALRRQLLSDPHPPGAQRADIVRNRPEWYAAFGVRPGARLYLPPEQRVDVW